MKHSFRTLSLAAASAFAMLGIPAPADAQAQPVSFESSQVRFDIPSQSLASALTEFSRQSQIPVLVPNDLVRGRQSAAVAGDMTPREAFRRLTEGSGLRIQQTQSGGLTLIQDQTTSPTRLGATSDAVSSEEEIIVTARKREESLQDVPMSIAVIGAEDIQRRGLIGMEDYLRSIPSVNQIDNGATSNAIVIRGIATSPEFENSSSGTTVATYFGEAPITAAAGRGAGGIDVRPVDIERIEVLRGPQGTTYGSASLSGAVRIIPAAPDLNDFGGRITTALSETTDTGSDNHMLQGVLNVPLIADQLAVRVVAYEFDESGFYNNNAGVDPTTIAQATTFGFGSFVTGYTQNDVGRMQTVGARASILWEPTSTFSVALNYLTQDIEQDGSPVSTNGSYQQTRYPVAPQGRRRGETGELFDTSIDLTNLVVSYDLGWGDLTSSTSWIDGAALGVVTTNFLLGPTSTTTPSYFESFTEEARLVTTFAGPLNFILGAYYEEVDDGSAQSLHWPGALATNPLAVKTDPMALIQVDRSYTQNAFFGEVSYDVTDRFTATIGGRLYSYDRTTRTLQDGGLFGFPIGGATPVTRDAEDDGTSRSANLTYDVDDNTLIYLSWGEGFRLGQPAVPLPALTCDTNNDGIIDNTSIPLASTGSINPDNLENYELGAKFSRLNGRFTLDASVFHINWEGLPIRTVTPAPCNRAYTANVGAAESDGVEFQARLLLGEGWRVDFGAGYTDARLAADAPGITGSPRSGAPLPGAPSLSANLAVQYEFLVGEHNAFARFDTFYAGEFFGDLLESPNLRAGDYFKVDARAGIIVNHVSLELFARNLTNEDAFTWRGASGGTNPQFGYQLRPRTVGIQLQYEF